MKARKLLLASVLALLLVGSSAGFAAPPQLLTLSLSGAIFSSGSQQYSHQGGNVVAGSFLGAPLDSQSVLHYSLSATVSGLAVSGSASFDLKSHPSQGGGDGKGKHSAGFEVEGQATITGYVPGETFPIGCTFGLDCTSVIPAVYTGVAHVSMTQGDLESKMDLPMAFESAFLNPGGGPIFFASDDGEIMVVAMYSQAQVVWRGIQMGGAVVGTLNGSPVSGQFGMGVSAFEDLRNQFELESGSIAFTGMSNPALNAFGHFVGRSTIPPGVPCPSGLGFPLGTCVLTGFSSSGVFSQTTQTNMHIVGKYVTTWTVPAVAFTSAVTASLGPGHS